MASAVVKLLIILIPTETNKKQTRISVTTNSYAKTQYFLRVTTVALP